MKLISVLAAILIAGLGSCSVKAQVNVVPVNGGTGNLVSIPIPGANGLNVTVGTGSAAAPLQNIANTSGAQHLYLGDDSNANVPLGFSFPFFGQNFSNSWMYSNGIVSFTSGNIPGSGCCGGQSLPGLAAGGSRNSVYNYMIAPLWTDLVDTTGNATWYKGTSNSMTYGWYNTAEYGTNNRSSFEVNINSSGTMDVRYGSAFVSTNHTVTSGMTGNLAAGEYYQYYNGPGFNIPSTNPVSWGAYQGTGSGNICYSNPLVDPSCPGYTDAYRTQQCTVSALYDPSCPGYTQAYFTQQCSLDPLYNSNCPGYQTAYHNQQCSINPLFATDCTGYQQAYHDQQCSINVLSFTDCPGYASAYLAQQCSINPLYSTTCSGYQAAYKAQQCAANPLYATDCPGYAQAYFNQQCSLNGLYSTQCSNYGTAYATQQALLQSQQQSTTTTTTSTNTSSTTASTTQPSVAVSSNGTVSTSVPIVSDTNVNNVITSTSTSTAPTTPSAPVQLTTPTSSQQSSPAAPMAPVAVAQSQQKTEEKKNDSSSSPTANAPSTGNNSSDSKSSDQPKTARQELQERRESAAKAKAVEAGKNLGDTMGKAASMEQQAQVQNVVIAAMGYSPAFEAYKVMMPDVPGYKPYSIYKNQTNVDNRRLGYGLFGATDKLHSDMVDSQYNKGN
jgi:hypothetical protein